MEFLMALSISLLCTICTKVLKIYLHYSNAYDVVARTRTAACLRKNKSRTYCQNVYKMKVLPHPINHHRS